jgi:hypothetical protein
MSKNNNISKGGGTMKIRDMNKERLAIQFILIVAVLLSFPVSGAFAGDLGPNNDIIVLVPGQTRAVTCELEYLIPESYHTAWVLTIGKGNLSITAAKTSSLGPDGEIIFGLAGFVDVNPVYGAAYGAGKIMKKTAVPEFGIGMLFTGVITKWGDPFFPVTLSLTYTLEKPAGTTTPGTTTTTTMKPMTLTP